MTELARYKYQEAEYFLNRLRQADNEDHVRYNLDAFLAAARAVTETLELDIDKRASETSDETHWNHELARFMRHKRNFVIHDRPSLVKREVVNLNEDEAGIIVRTSPNRSSITSGPQVSTNRVQEPAEGAISGESALPEEGETHSAVEKPTDEMTRYYFVDFEDTGGNLHEVPDEYTEMPIPDVCEAYLELLNSVLEKWAELTN